MPVTLLRDPSQAGDLLLTDLEYGALLRDPSWREGHLGREQRRVEGVLAQGGLGLLWQAKRDVEGAPSALALLRFLPWDTAHFGFACADLVRFYASEDLGAEEREGVLVAVVEEARRRQVKLLSARLRADQLAALQTLQRLGNFLLVDTSVELGGVRPLPGTLAVGLELRDPRPADVEELEEVAAGFTQNRFHRDPGIPRRLAREVYLSWVREAAAGRRGSLLVAEREGSVAGFATFHATDDALGVDVVGLLAVHPRRRGSGVLAALVGGCADRLGGRAVVSSTQVTNAAALRGFGRAGLRPFGARHVLHGWL